MALKVGHLQFNCAEEAELAGGEAPRLLPKGDGSGKGLFQQLGLDLRQGGDAGSGSADPGVGIGLTAGEQVVREILFQVCLLYTSPSPRD